MPIRLRETLKKRGFEAILVTEALGVGVKNHDVAELARHAQHIIITFNEDFLRFRSDIKPLVKVIYIQMHPPDPRKADEMLDKWIEACLKILHDSGAVRSTETGPIAQTE